MPDISLVNLLATSLPFIVAATQIGVITGRIPTETATALVCAGLVSVLVFPALALVSAKNAPGPDRGGRVVGP